MLRRAAGSLFLVTLVVSGGCGMEPKSLAAPTAATPVEIRPTSTVAPTITPSPSPTPRFARSVDVRAYSRDRQGAWFRVGLEDLPEVQVEPQVVVTIQREPEVNRHNGQIAGTLAARYLFLQFGDIREDLIEQHAATIRALFIRSALMSFVDYLGGTVLDWDGRSSRIPLDVEGAIRLANRMGIPVYLELNYSDYIPGPLGSGVESLVPADNLSRTIEYLRQLDDSGLLVAGVTFGDEIGDDAGFGEAKPTTATSDLPGRFIDYARALKDAFPDLAIYAFDSYIGAARGQVDQYFEPLTRIRKAEVEDGRHLLDGFLFRESYVYIDRDGKLMSSQRLVVDTDSLHRQSPVYRYDTRGVSYPEADQDYLHTLLAWTEKTFGRQLQIGISEYLPAGPTQIDESDTSAYADIDFILHYADVMGIYASLGLDYVATFLFANEVEQAKCYLDRQGNEGVNYPVFAQLAEDMQGELLQVDKTPADAASRLRVYAARDDARIFIMLLNREVSAPQAVRLQLSGVLDLVLDLPPRSYTSVIVDPAGAVVSGIGWQP